MPGDRNLSHLRAILIDAATAGATVTYGELADAMGFETPGVIRRTSALLERAMAEDAAAARPFLAAVVVSRAEGVPRRGFFERAQVLGRFHGEPNGPEARAFFEAEFRAAIKYWGRRSQG